MTSVLNILIYRSEIHENMNCNRCESDTFAVNETSGSSEPVVDGKHVDFRVHDIGGFAQIAGCLQELTSPEMQVHLSCIHDEVIVLTLERCNK